MGFWDIIGVYMYGVLKLVYIDIDPIIEIGIDD